MITMAKNMVLVSDVSLLEKSGNKDIQLNSYI